MTQQQNFNLNELQDATSSNHQGVLNSLLTQLANPSPPAVVVQQPPPSTTGSNILGRGETPRLSAAALSTEHGQILGSSSSAHVNRNHTAYSLLSDHLSPSPAALGPGGGHSASQVTNALRSTGAVSGAPGAVNSHHLNLLNAGTGAGAAETLCHHTQLARSMLLALQQQENTNDTLTSVNDNLPCSTGTQDLSAALPASSQDSETNLSQNQQLSSSLLANALPDEIRSSLLQLLQSDEQGRDASRRILSIILEQQQNFKDRPNNS